MDCIAPMVRHVDWHQHLDAVEAALQWLWSVCAVQISSACCCLRMLIGVFPLHVMKNKGVS